MLHLECLSPNDVRTNLGPIPVQSRSIFGR